MRKTIRILSIISTALVGLSFLLKLFSILLQTLIGNIYHHLNSPSHISFMLPIIPVVPILLTLACVLLLVFFAGKDKHGIWSEILVIVALSLVIPMINSIASLLFNQLLNAMSSEHIAAYVSVLSITNFFTTLADLGVALAYVVCGMSIAYKKSSSEPRRIYVQ